MTIEQLRRLKHLSEMPTHSPASLEELNALVNRVIGGYVMSEEYGECGCNLCKHQVCDEKRCKFYAEYPENNVTCMEWVDECEHYPEVCNNCQDGCNFEMRGENE